MPRKKAAPKSVNKPEHVPRFTKSGLGRAWGLSASQITQWVAAGLPVGTDGKIALDEATRWLRQHERREKMRSDGSDAGKRRMDAEAQLMELRLAKELGDVVLAADSYSAAADEATRVRSVLTQMPSNFAPKLAARLSCGVREASALLREIADEVSGQLANEDDAEDVAA